MTKQSQHIVVCALYHFVPLDNFAELKEPLLNLMQSEGVKGTLLLAREGINGTIAGTRTGIDKVLSHLRSYPSLADLDYKESYDSDMPFYRTKVKLKKEIVTMGVEGIDPLKKVGTHIDPQEWNALIERDDVILIDTRNNYEVAIGTFKGAINPQTETFREFPDYVRQHLDKNKHKKVAMFCTGGIRCEKSTAFLKEEGFEEVYHLKGGILNYLEKVPEEQSLWEGECFVFDNRVTVNHALERGQFDQCHACRLPISGEDKASVHYELGVSCPHCYERINEKDRNHFRERQRQIELSQKRGEEHIGGAAALILAERKAAKYAEREEQRKYRKHRTARSV
jgi:UPF0176 protein